MLRFLKINVLKKIELVYSVHFEVLYKMVKKIFEKKFFPGSLSNICKKFCLFLISPFLKSFKTMLKSGNFLYSGVFEYEEHDGDLIFCQKIRSPSCSSYPKTPENKNLVLFNIVLELYKKGDIRIQQNFLQILDRLPGVKFFSKNFFTIL